jgi:hypothetical protein
MEKSYWMLINKRTGNPLKEKYSKHIKLFSSKSLAIVTTMDFPAYHVVKVAIKYKGAKP